MKYAAILIVIYTLSSSCSAQTESRQNYFEGIINYQISFRLKEQNLDTAYLRQLIGYTSTFYFKEGNYKQLYDLKNLQEEIYHRSDNRSYFKRDNTDTLYWRSMAKQGDSILKFEIKQESVIISGINCNVIEIYNLNKIKRYYYNTDMLRIDPRWFSAFTYFNKGFISEKIKSLFVRCELEYPQFIAIFTATSIQTKQIDDTFFRLPENAVLVEDK